MTSSLFYILFKHGNGEFLYSLYKIKLSRHSKVYQIDNPSQLSPTRLFERKHFPSGMRCVLLRSKFYFLGGQKKFEVDERNRYPPNVYIFDPATTAAAPTNTYVISEATPMKTGKPEPVLLFVADGKMYALSGSAYVFDNFEYFEVFDPNSNTWDTLPSPPPIKKEIFDMEHAVVNRKVYIMAGEYHSWNDYALHCFDLDNNKWIPPKKLKCPALPLRYSIAGFVKDNKTVYGNFNDTIVGFGPVEDPEDTDDNDDDDDDDNDDEVGFGPVEDPKDTDDDEDTDDYEVGFVPVEDPKDTDDDEVGYGAFFKSLIRFSPEGPVNFFKRPVMVDTSSSLMHLGENRFCYVVSGNPPLRKDPLPKDTADHINDPRSRYINLTTFEALTDSSTAKYLHSADFVAETTWDTGAAILQNCILKPVGPLFLLFFLS